MYDAIVALTDDEQRNAAVISMYEFTYQLARLEAPSEQDQQLFAALRTNQLEADPFLSIMAGTVSIPEFFADKNVQRIVQAALPLAA